MLLKHSAECNLFGEPKQGLHRVDQWMVRRSGPMCIATQPSQLNLPCRVTVQTFTKGGGDANSRRAEYEIVDQGKNEIVREFCKLPQLRESGRTSSLYAPLSTSLLKRALCFQNCCVVKICTPPHVAFSKARDILSARNIKCTLPPFKKSGSCLELFWHSG